MRQSIRFATLFALILVTGCGDIRVGTGAPSDAGFGRLIDNIQAVRGRNTPDEPQEQQLTRAALNRVKQKLVRVTFTKYNITPVMTQVASRNGFETYLSKAQQTISLRRGVLSHTRGLPFDLLETDFRNPADKQYRFLIASNDIAELRVSCTRARVGSETIEIVERRYATTVIEESCTSDVVTFKNKFWTDGSGTVWKSEQWIGPNHGYAVIEKLN